MPRKRIHALPTDEEVTRMAAELRQKLQNIGIEVSGHKALDRLPVDLTDVYVICANYQHLVENLLAMPESPDPEDVLRIILKIEQHLYDHLSYHYKPLRTGLERLLKTIEPDEQRREDFLYRYFNEMVGSVKKLKPESSKEEEAD